MIALNNSSKNLNYPIKIELKVNKENKETVFSTTSASQFTLQLMKKQRDIIITTDKIQKLIKNQLEI